MKIYSAPLATTCVLVLTASVAWAADSQTKVIGFRNGDRGVFPDDCKPPLKFNGVTGENLVWKTPMPNFGNAGVIVVGKQVIVLCDVGWPAGEGDTPTLRSYDADTGKPLWTRPIDPYDCLSPEEAKVLRPLRAKFFEAARLEDEAMHRLGLLEPDDAEGRAKILDEVAAKTGIDRELLDSNKRFFTNGPGGHNHMAGALPILRHPLWGKYGQTGCHWNWTGMGIACTPPISDGKLIYVFTYNRTVTAVNLDGTIAWNVYLHEINRRLDSHVEEDFGCSPVLTDGKLLKYMWGEVWCFDTANGKLLWKTVAAVPPLTGGTRHSFGMVQVAVRDAKGGPDVPAVFVYRDVLIRISDGKLLGQHLTGSVTGAAAEANAYCLGSADGVLYLPVHDKGPLTDGKAGDAAVRFVADGDTAKAELVWFQPSTGGRGGSSFVGAGSFPTVYQGTVVARNASIRDLASGRLLNQPSPRGALGNNGYIIADGHAIGILPGTRTTDGKPVGRTPVSEMHLVCQTARLTPRGFVDVVVCPLELVSNPAKDPQKAAQIIALTGNPHQVVYDYGWHNYGTAPFVSGNRLFVRTYDWLYCFGDRSVPFRPSRDFEAK